MKRDEKELKVIVCGELDLQKLPKEMFDAFITAVVENITQSMKEEGARKKPD